MAKTFTYAFSDGSNLTVTTADNATQINAGDPGGTTYSGYAITNVSGTFAGQTVAGLFGTSGVYEQGNGGDVHDNAIFVSSTQGEGGSSYLGIDTNGIDFSLQNGNHINLYQSFNNQGNGATTLSYSTFNAQGAPVGNQNVNAPVTQSNYNTVTCYVTGTRIRVIRDGAEADVPVEDLRVGDLAVTASGAHRPIRWIGSRLTDTRRHPRPEEAMPVRIRAGALGDNRPARDLVVSPGHAIALDVLGEVLIPAIALANGSTITQEEVDTVTYWHVELDSHDLLIAEGQAAESYLDMGNRAFFARSTGDASVVDLAASPDADPASRTHADFCRPYHDGGPLLAFVRERIAARAAAQGWRLSGADPWAGVYVLADGVRVEPEVRASAARFAIPAGARDVWLVSPAASPSEIGLSADGRRLGLRLAELRVGDGWDARAVGLDDPLLCVGFHGIEGEAGALWRWTAGRARLPAALWQDAGLDADRTLVLRLNADIPALPRWTGPEAAVKGEAVAA